MTETLVHRGPDGRDVQQVGTAIFGHCRLSIIDLEGGAQPIQSQCGRVLLSFNGEIFNYRELRTELQGEYEFQTKSDTEVILALYLCRGVEGFPRLNGQFAFAIHDSREGNRTYLVRDRLGEKPLYYAQMKDRLIFASEIKAMAGAFRSLGYPLHIDNEAFSSFLALNYIPGEASFLQGVRSLKPGSWLRFDGLNTLCQEYWSGEASDASGRPLDDFASRLRDSANIRMRSDVPVGLFLSGGIDSTVAAFALRDHDVKAFIADFQEEDFSEAPFAQQVARMWNIQHEVVPIRFQEEESEKLIRALVFHGDRPLADSSSLPVYLLSREASKERKVVITGDGADELFGGYLTYPATRLAARLPQFLRLLGKRCSGVAQFLSRSDQKVGFGEKLDRFLRNLDLRPAAAHFAWNGMFRAEEKARLIHPERLAQISTLETFEKLAEELGLFLADPSLKSLLIADQKTYLAHDILQKVDGMTMAHGLEARPLFLDHRLVEFARGLSENYLVDGRRSKVLLRLYLELVAPEYDLNRKKQGFSIPIHHWFRTRLKNFAGDLFHSKIVEESGLYNAEYLRTLWRQHQSAERSIGFELWGVMVSLLWYEMFLGVRA